MPRAKIRNKQLVVADMPKGNTANQSLQRPDQSLTALFGRLTDDLTELFDAKLELLKTELKRR